MRLSDGMDRTDGIDRIDRIDRVDVVRANGIERASGIEGIARRRAGRAARRRTWAGRFALVAGALGMALGVFGGRQPADAAPPGRAELLIDKGDGQVILRSLPWRAGMTGQDLLQAGGLPLVTQGGAVCAIDGLGCPADDCFCACKGARGCRYWKYHQGDAAGRWREATVGPAQQAVPEGGLEGWVWGRAAPLTAPPAWRAGRLALDWLLAQQEDGGGLKGHVGFGAELAFGHRALGLGLHAAEGEPAGPDLLGFLRRQAPAYALGAAATGKAVAGIAAAGGDPRAAGGVDLLARLRGHYDPADGQYGAGTWDQAWAILGLVAAAEPVPPAALGALGRLAQAGGGWGPDAAGPADADSSGLALQAALAAGLPSDDALVRGALDHLAASQEGDGGWGHGGAGNLNSTAYALGGILAAGQDPRAAPWTEGHPGPLDFLLAAQGPDGRLRFGAQDAAIPDLVASLQALPSLAGRPLAPLGPAPALRRGLEWLRAQQQADGGFGGSGPGATVDAVLALAAAGADPDPRHPSGRRPGDLLLAQGAAFAEGSLAAAGKLALGVKVLGLDAAALPGAAGPFDLARHLEAGAAAAVGRAESSVWDLSWAVLGLRALERPLPEGLAADLAAAASPAGGWGYARAAAQPDPDSSGLALEALAAAGWGREAPAVQEAEAYLLTAQLPSGGWGYDGALSADSSAAVALGLSAQGHHLDAAGWMAGDADGWRRRGAVDALLGLQAADGSFRGFSPLLATTAALRALAGQVAPAEATQGRRLLLPLLIRGR